MVRVAGVLAVGLACWLLVGDPVVAGAKDGKTRWSAKQTGACKWFPAIKVPAGEDGKPGIEVIKIVFKAKELAEFFVIGDGDTDLDLYVHDSSGKEIAKDVGLSDLCVCRWTPEREEEFTIRIHNLGRVYNVAQAGCN
jgi:hypothetical protein